MRAGQLEDHAAQRLGIAQHQGRRGAGERDVDLVGQPGIELAGLVVDRDLFLVLGGGDLGELEIVAHTSTVPSPGKPRPTCALIW
jgi:hypothetical protein